MRLDKIIVFGLLGTWAAAAEPPQATFDYRLPRDSFVTVVINGGTTDSRWQSDRRLKLFGLGRDGKVRWTYPNPFPSNTHESPRPRLGDIQHTLGVEGVAHVNDSIGDVFQLAGNKGPRYLFTTDGLFVCQLFGDVRLAPLQQTVHGATFNMRLDEYSP